MFDDRLTIALGALILCVFGLGVLRRFQPAEDDHRGEAGPPDWIILTLPIILAIQQFRQNIGLLTLGFLVVAALVRQRQGNYGIQGGPLYLLLASGIVVFSRSTSSGIPITFGLVGILALRVIGTTDVRRVLTSLIDGCGLFLLVSAAAYALGMRSPGYRLDNLANDSGFTRIFFPLSSSLNIPPVIAAIYITAFVFLFWDQRGLHRWFRILCLPAAGFVLFGGGTRAMIASPVIIMISLSLAPSISRWMAQAVTFVTALSAFSLPTILNSTMFDEIGRFASLFTPTRTTDATAISSFGGRELIWRGSIDYWNEWVTSLPATLLGFGQFGPYRSGASAAYREELSWIIRNPELAHLHNSALQQLFDGGVVGVLLLFSASFWASLRLSRRLRDWGNLGIVAITTFIILLLSAITEASIAPGPGQQTLWIFLIVVSTACQATPDQGHKNDSPDTAMRVAGHHEARSTRSHVSLATHT